MSQRLYNIKPQTLLEFLSSELIFADRLDRLHSISKAEAFFTLLKSYDDTKNSKDSKDDTNNSGRIVLTLQSLTTKLIRSVGTYLSHFGIATHEPFQTTKVQELLSTLKVEEFCSMTMCHIQSITKDLADWCSTYSHWQKIETDMRTNHSEAVGLCTSQLVNAQLSFPDFSSPFQRGPRYNLLLRAIIDDLRGFYEAQLGNRFEDDADELIQQPSYGQFYTLFQCTQELVAALNFQQGRNEFEASENASILRDNKKEVALAYSKGDDYFKGKSRDYLFGSSNVHEIRDDAGVFTSKVKTTIPYSNMTIILHSDINSEGQDVGWLITNDLYLDGINYHPHIKLAFDQLRKNNVTQSKSWQHSVAKLLKEHKTSENAWYEVSTSFKGFQSNLSILSMPNALQVPRPVYFFRLDLATFPQFALPQQEQQKSTRRRSLGGELHISNTNVMQLLNNREEFKLDKMIFARFSNLVSLVDLLTQIFSVTPAPAGQAPEKKHRRRLSFASFGGGDTSAPSPTHSAAQSTSISPPIEVELDRDVFGVPSSVNTPSSNRRSLKRRSADQPTAQKRKSFDVVVPSDDLPVQLSQVSQTPSNALKPVNPLRLNNTTGHQALAQSISTPSTTRRQVLPTTQQTLKSGVGNKYPVWRKYATTGGSASAGASAGESAQSAPQTALANHVNVDPNEQCNQQ